MNGKPWTQKEIDYLVAHFPDDTAPEISAVLGRSAHSIYGKAHAFGLEKSEVFKQSHKRRTFQGWEGLEHRFEKGHTPWNKGKKGICTGGVQTQFRKGHLPHNTLFDGAITIRTDSHGRKYKMIRLSSMNWMMLHVKVWIDANGPVPKGMIVIFKNTDTMDVRLENLDLISKAENMSRNTIHRYPDELKCSIRALGKLKRLINEKNQSE